MKAADCMTEAQLCRCGCGSRPAKHGAEYVRGHRPLPDPVDAFWEHVDRSGACWLWTGNVGTHGYGRFWNPQTRRNVLAHRFAFGLTADLVPGLEVDHLCRQRLCVNVLHMEQVTGAENKRRAMAARPPVDACRHGHTYDAENTVTNSAGYRECLTCLRARGRRA